MICTNRFSTTSHGLRGSPCRLQGRCIGNAAPRRSVALKLRNTPRLPHLTEPHYGVSRGNQIRATADAIGEELSPGRESEGELALACPICHKTEFPVTSTKGAATSALSCKRCSRTFNSTDDFVDLTLTSGVEFKSYQKKLWGGTTTFQSPLVSFIYERGWRQGFIRAGFPGADAEFDLAMEYLRPALGAALVDMSCGSGLFTRRFAKSGDFSRVIAVDFSENMLRQTKTFLEEDSAIDSSAVALVRADVGRLPFASGSVAAIHAGAAIHCWPEPQQALAEISRVLRPGGIFVASTFLDEMAPLGQLFGDDVVRPLKGLPGAPSNSNASVKLWEEAELRDLCKAVGLQTFRKQRRQRFIMFSVTKPVGPQ